MKSRRTRTRTAKTMSERPLMIEMKKSLRIAKAGVMTQNKERKSLVLRAKKMSMMRKKALSLARRSRR